LSAELQQLICQHPHYQGNTMRNRDFIAILYSVMNPTANTTSAIIGKLIAVLLLLCTTPKIASCQHHPTTVLLVPGIRADDLKRPECPHLTAFIQQSASAWMVCRAARPVDPQDLRKDGRDPLPSLILTLGAGSRARVGSESEKIVSPTPHAFHTQPFPDPGALSSLIASNKRLDHTVHVGLLGDLLHKSGIRTYVAGNLDAALPDRSLFLLVMDHRGIADDAGPRLTKFLTEDTAAYGIKTNLIGILTDYDLCAHRDQFRVIGIGDLLRADVYAQVVRSQPAAQQRAEALKVVDRAITEFETRTLSEPGGILILVSPGPADSTTNTQDRLGLLAARGAGIGQGLLTSASTRRIGLLDNTDFLPSAAAWLGASLPYSVSGSPAHTASATTSQNIAESLTAIHGEITSRADIQNLLGGLPSIQLVLVILAGLLPFGWPGSKIPKALALLIVSMPLAMLLLPPVVPPVRYASARSLAISCLLIAAAALVTGSRNPRCLKLAAAALLLGLVGISIADLCSGSHLMQIAWMSYSATDGSRFYGIGNEYMGAIIGAFCGLYMLLFSAAGSTANSLRTRAYFLLTITATLVMFFPLAGAKAGALPSAGSALLALVWNHPAISRKVRAQRVGLCAVGLVAAGFAFVALDRSAGITHVARASAVAAADSRSTVIKRKIANEVRLIIHSPWMPTLIAACGLVLYRRRVATGAERTAINASLVGGAACLLLNDAGVLAAANVFLVSAGASLLTGAYARTELSPTLATAAPVEMQQPATTV
jgi:hypothetical protein